jgi:hypothetical protein
MILPDTPDLESPVLKQRYLRQVTVLWDPASRLFHLFDGPDFLCSTDNENDMAMLVQVESEGYHPERPHYKTGIREHLSPGSAQKNEDKMHSLREAAQRIAAARGTPTVMPISKASLDEIEALL